MLSSCAANVVLLPSGASHLPLTLPPTPEPNGVTTASFGLLSLNGVPMKPQTTGPFTPGATEAPAWMCALVKLSLVSAVCEPVKSMLLTVAVIVMAVSPAIKKKCAVPYEAGRRAPPVVIGLVGGTSCEFVRLTVKSFGARLAEVSSLSTYWSLVSVDGYLSTNSGQIGRAHV